MIEKIKQQDLSDCGPACLASIFSEYGLRVPISQIRFQASTDKKGTNLLGLVEAAKHFGFDASGLKVNFIYLTQIKAPVIAHLQKDKLLHFVVVLEASNSQITIMDPALGEFLNLSVNEFKKEWTGIILEVKANSSFKPGNYLISRKLRFSKILKPHFRYLISAFFLSVIYTLIGLLTALFIQIVIDDIIPKGSIENLLLFCVVMFSIVIIQHIIGFWKSKISLNLGLTIDEELMTSFLKKVVYLPQSFFDRMRSGEILSRLGDAIKIRAFISDMMMSIMLNAIVLISAFTLMIVSEWRLGFTLLGVLPLFGFTLFIINKRNRKVQRLLMEKSASLESELIETIQNMSSLKIFNIEMKNNEFISSTLKEVLSTARESGYISIASQLTTSFINRAIIVLLFAGGGLMIIKEQMSLGELMAFYALIGYFIQPISELINSNQRYQDAMIATQRLFDIQDLEAERNQKEGIRIHSVRSIIFQKVSFRYGAGRDLLSGLDLEIIKGKLQVLIGESGSGKSTIAHLCKKLYSINSGELQINDTPIDELSTQSIRNRIATLPQEIDLFSSSLASNIALGDSDYDETRIQYLVEQIEVQDFINDLPFGLETLIGENGVNLSGGQQQIVGFLRALYTKPDILILDEPTSALDSQTEKRILSQLVKLRNEGMGILLITHRLKSAILADQISILKDGKIIEEGTHYELFKVDTEYFKMWRNQSPFVEQLLKMSA